MHTLLDGVQTFCIWLLPPHNLMSELTWQRVLQNVFRDLSSPVRALNSSGVIFTWLVANISHCTHSKAGTTTLCNCQSRTLRAPQAANFKLLELMLSITRHPPVILKLKSKWVGAPAGIEQSSHTLPSHTCHYTHCHCTLAITHIAITHIAITHTAITHLPLHTLPLHALPLHTLTLHTLTLHTLSINDK